MVVPPPRLAAFFDGMVPVLRGSAAPERVADDDALPGVTFYQHLTRAELRRYLGGCCPGVAAACELHRAGSFATLSSDYFDAHPPRGWDPGAVGDGLADFLRQRGAPAYLAEIADLHVLVRKVALADDTTGDPLERTLFVRRYETTAPLFVQRILAGDKPHLPSDTPTVAVVFRSYRTHRGHVLIPTLELLRSLLNACNGVDDGNEGGYRILVERGLVPGRASPTH